MDVLAAYYSISCLSSVVILRRSFSNLNVNATCGDWNLLTETIPTRSQK